ncbi:hypothetical protein X740_24440 [Mesorhizobium sp. LNHC221B00]|nr:hypothetical protein X740_24440 [Mesorhizobium sp. LNHC221B00]
MAGPDPSRRCRCAIGHAKNLFDTRKTICSAGYCYRDEGRSLFASLRYRF